MSHAMLIAPVRQNPENENVFKIRDKQVDKNMHFRDPNIWAVSWELPLTDYFKSMRVLQTSSLFVNNNPAYWGSFLAIR